MKKKTGLISFIAMALLLTACGNGTAATTSTTTTAAEYTVDTNTATNSTTPLNKTEATTAPTVEETTTEATTETTTETTTAPTVEETTTTTADPDAVIISCLDFRGNMTDVPMKKNEYNNYEGKLEEAYFRYSSGEYYSSEKNPELFDIADYSCTAECKTGEEITVRSGDKFGPLAVKDAYSSFYCYEQSDGTLGGGWMSHNATFDGSVTLDGYLVYFTEDEYGVCVGDLLFIPLPESLVANSFPIAQSQLLNKAYLFMSENIDFAFCGDTQPLILGNLMTDYADNAEVNAAVDGTWNVKQATVTLGGLDLGASEQFGNRLSRAKIESLTLKN